MPKDVAVQWKLYDDFDSRGTFYTDSNGLGNLEREVGHTKSVGGSQPFPRKPEEQIEGALDDCQSFGLAKAGIKLTEVQLSDEPKNFYPVDTAISVKDGQKIVTIMNDRSQAGTVDRTSIALIQ